MKDEHPRTVVFSSHSAQDKCGPKLLSEGCVEIGRDEKHFVFVSCDWPGPAEMEEA